MGAVFNFPHGPILTEASSSAFGYFPGGIPVVLRTTTHQALLAGFLHSPNLALRIGERTKGLAT